MLFRIDVKTNSGNVYKGVGYSTLEMMERAISVYRARGWIVDRVGRY